MGVDLPSYEIDTTSKIPSEDKNTKTVDYKGIGEKSKESYSTTHTEFEGNQEVGTVNFIQQVHTRPGIEKHPELKNTVGQFQYEIFNTLKKDGVKHVFAEGFDFDLTPHHDRNLAKEIQKAEESGNKEKLYEIFSMPGGAALIYAQVERGVTIHKVCTQDEKTQTNNAIFADGTTSIDDPHDAKFHEMREQYALREIMQFLEKNPGEKVALVYGTAHNFTDNFHRIPDKHKHKLPKLTTTQYPNLEKKADETAEKILARQEAEKKLKEL